MNRGDVPLSLSLSLSHTHTHYETLFPSLPAPVDYFFYRRPVVGLLKTMDLKPFGWDDQTDQEIQGSPETRKALQAISNKGGTVSEVPTILFGIFCFFLFFYAIIRIMEFL